MGFALWGQTDPTLSSCSELEAGLVSAGVTAAAAADLSQSPWSHRVQKRHLLHHSSLMRHPVLTFMFDAGRRAACQHTAVSRSLLICSNLLFSSLAILPTPFPAALKKLPMANSRLILHTTSWTRVWCEVAAEIVEVYWWDRLHRCIDSLRIWEMRLDGE